MRKKIFISIGIISIIVFVFVIIGYFKLKSQKNNAEFKEIPQDLQPSPLPITNQEIESDISNQQSSDLVATKTDSGLKNSEKYKVLFKDPYIYIKFDFPILYVFDPREGLVKYLNIEDESYREIFKINNVDDIKISENKEKIAFRINNQLQLLDVKLDILKNFPSFTKNFAFANDKIVLYISNDKNISYLGYWDSKYNLVKIRDFSVFDVEFSFLPPNSVLIYKKEGLSPVFLADLKSNSPIKIFLEQKENYSILPNKKGNLIFVSDKEESKVINLKNEKLITFPWQTTKEKCSFNEFLVCAFSENFDYQGWHLFKYHFDTKLVIYDPNKNDFQEIILEKMFDIVDPQITPLGITFYNRLDGKIYVFKNE